MRITSSNSGTMVEPKLTGNHCDLGYQVRLDGGTSMMAYVTAEEARAIADGWAAIADELVSIELGDVA